jgi:hypothetical protein
MHCQCLATPLPLNPFFHHPLSYNCISLYLFAGRFCLCSFTPSTEQLRLPFTHLRSHVISNSVSYSNFARSLFWFSHEGTARKPESPVCHCGWVAFFFSCPSSDPTLIRCAGDSRNRWKSHSWRAIRQVPPTYL